MKMSKRIISGFLSCVIVLSIVICPMFSIDSLALESTGNATIDAFINDSRFTDGAPYGNRSPYLSSWDCAQCCAYCADYVKYCYGKDSPWDVTQYTNANEIQAGDVVLVGNGNNGNGHWFVVLKRSGNNLYVAEGNMGSGSNRYVRIGWNYSIKSSSEINGASYSFTRGHHYGNPQYVNQTPIGCVDYCQVSNGDKIWVRGWAFDPTEPSKSVTIHVYVNDKHVKTFSAAVESSDVNNAYSISGKHRFDVTFDPGAVGNMTIDLYALDTQGGTNPLLGEHPNQSTRFSRHIHEPYNISSGTVAKAPTTTQNGTWNIQCSCGSNTTLTIPKLTDANIRDGIYRIATTNGSGLYVSVTPNQTVSNGNIALYSKGAATQQFTFKRNSDGTYFIYVGSYVLDVDGAAYKGNVQLYSLNSSDAQKWYVTSWNNGYRLVNKAFYLNMDIYGNGTTSGTNIHTWPHNGSVAQTFKLELVECINHTWNSGVVTKQPAIGVTGVKTYTCTACGKTKTETIPALVNTTYTVSLSSVSNGSASLSKTTAYSGDEITVTATPATGYVLNAIKVNGTAISGNKFTMPAKNTTVEVTFTKANYTVSVSKVGEGTATLSKTSANYGDEITVTATPATGYALDKITVNGTAISGNKFTMPAQNTTVAVTFKKVSYTVSLSSVSNGTASLSKTSAYYGDEITVTYSPATGYILDAIKVNGTAISGTKFTMSAKNTTVAVTFKKATYTVTLSTVTNGTASLSKISANAGDEITVTVSPSSGFELDYIKVNGTAISDKKFTMPAKNTTVEVAFKEKVHTLTKVSAKPAKCTEDGNITYYVCKDTECGCKKIYSDAAGQNEISLVDTVVPATGHSLEKVSAKEAKCTEKGHLAHWKCSKCEKLFKDSEGKLEITAENVEVDALGHDKDNLKHVEAKKETYKEDGNIEHYICPRCGKKFADPDCKKELTEAEIVIPKKGAAELDETAVVDGLKYKVTNPSTDGTGTVTLTGVDEKKASVVIPGTVEIKESTYIVDRIAAKAFYKDLTLKTVVIGANIRFIDSCAFYGCKNLVKVSGGGKVETIAASVFAYCSKLKTFVITSPALRLIGSGAFNKDKKLKTIYIKNTVKLTKAGVKKSLKGSSVKKVKVKKSKVKAYKKIFKKKNSGRSVKVKK